MTERKITYALNRIKSCKEAGYSTEALIRSYQLNVDLLRYIISQSDDDKTQQDKKVKALVKHLLEKATSDSRLKTIVSKKSFKALKPWLTKMDEFFKALKMCHAFNAKPLQSETEKIYGILKISANKLIVNKNAIAATKKQS
jgi:hypothetical protein